MQDTSFNKKHKPLKNFQRKVWFYTAVLEQEFYRLQGRTIVHLLHISKTGGTAVKDAIRANKPGQEYALFLHQHNTQFKNIRKGDKVVFFLRDPVSRFVSAFYSRKRQGQPRYNRAWTRKEKTIFEEFTTADQLASVIYSEDIQLATKAQSAMKAIGHVKTHYGFWLENSDYLESRRSDIFYIGFQESLEEDFFRLKKRLKLSSELKLPSDDSAAHKTPASEDKHLSSQAIENLRCWYEADYRLMEFCRQIASEFYG